MYVGVFLTLWRGNSASSVNKSERQTKAANLYFFFNATFNRISETASEKTQLSKIKRGKQKQQKCEEK